ncbi:MAG: SidA/IucD/PvdA family monooxygenase [Chloroflexi bacterium]|nr:SidA/IucD/PvdA family monooxygenase [Chloroflexota bacterium]
MRQLSENSVTTPLEANTIIIGASAAGLAVAACLNHANIPFILLEQADQVAQSWRNHYDRLHLHTSKYFSQLPYLPFPADVPRYPSRDQVVAYLENYARVNQISPRFGQKVISADFVDGKWQTETADSRYRSNNLVVATGYTHTPFIPHWKGDTDFRGQILHSSVYKNGASYRGKSVLVIGFGNSGGEIAIDLHEHGAHPAMSVRSPVNVIARDMFGLSSIALGTLLNWLPAHLSDRLTAPARRLTMGDTEALGLGKPLYGPLEQVEKTGRIPLIDIGTIRLIRSGQITLYPAIERFTPNGVHFANGAAESFEAVILATGYRPNLSSYLKPVANVTDATGIPLISGAVSNLPGLYFCGYHVSSNGMLREISREANRISGAIRNNQ